MKISVYGWVDEVKGPGRVTVTTAHLILNYVLQQLDATVVVACVMSKTFVVL